ncbi:MAG: sugar transferase [Chloroflexota bacterium]|nr:sugar transferase [Chloroflexota bacterium]
MKFTRSWLLLFDIALVVTAFVLSFAVRVELKSVGYYLSQYVDLLLPFLGLRICMFGVFGLYRPIWARAALRELVAVLSAVTVGSVAATMLLVARTLSDPIEFFPRFVLVYEWALTLILVGGMRYSLRLLDMRHMEPDADDEEQEHHKRVLRERLGEWLLEAPPDVRRLWEESQRWSVRRFTKRLFDIIVSLFALLCLAPFLLLLAVLIKLETPGPILADTPKRAGRGGTEFRMYKLRGMVQNAHMLLVNDPRLWEEYKKNNFKLENDPRLTRIGRIIRRSSIDELPNFVNVLHGEMSIVGPRPRYPFEIVAQAERFPHTQPDILRMLTVKPGITGPWQVSGRSKVGYEERTHLEARYAENHTLWEDILICLKTVRTVVSREGAH